MRDRRERISPSIRGSFHALRSNASLLLAAGTDVKTVASRLGHANPSLLFTTYSHVIEAADRTAADKLRQAFASGRC